MLVDVVRMRHEGRRLDPEAVRLAVPVRGVLSLSPQRPGWHTSQRNPPLLAGLVDPQASSWLLPPLDRASVRKIRNGALLIVGFEEWNRFVREVMEAPQAWWVRPVLSGPEAAVSVRPT